MYSHFLLILAFDLTQLARQVARKNSKGRKHLDAAAVTRNCHQPLEVSISADCFNRSGIIIDKMSCRRIVTADVRCLTFS